MCRFPSPALWLLNDILGMVVRQAVTEFALQKEGAAIGMHGMNTLCSYTLIAVCDPGSKIRKPKIGMPGYNWMRNLVVPFDFA